MQFFVWSTLEIRRLPIGQLSADRLHTLQLKAVKICFLCDYI